MAYGPPGLLARSLGISPGTALRHAALAELSPTPENWFWFDRLRASGLLVRPRTSTTSPNQFNGYAVALPDDRNAAGDTIWYSGASLAVDLTLPKLRQHWATS